MPPVICPHCGARVPARAAACPECGADESTGWSELAREENLDLPDTTCDYEEFIRREFGDGGPVKLRGRQWFWWLVGLGLIALLLFVWLR